MNLRIVNTDSRRRWIYIIVFFIAISTIGACFAEELMKEQSGEYLKEGIEAQKAGDVDRALSLYTKAAYANPNNAKAFNNLGTAYAQKGVLKKAEEQYQRAIAIDPYYSTALKNIAIIYAEKKDMEKFYEYWKRGSGLDIYSPFIIDDETSDKDK